MSTELLHPLVRQTLASLDASFEILPCEPHLADTAEFCGHYGIAATEACNTIIIALKTNPRSYVACLVRSDTKLDVNHRLAAVTGTKRMSFASSDETASLTGMLIGGVTTLGLPPDLPVLIDQTVFESPTVILGGGNRSSKVRIDPQVLRRLPNAREVEIAVAR